MALVSAFALMCQSVLVEKDDITSVIRAAEIFLVPPQALASPESTPVSMALYIHIRLSNDDEGPHSVDFHLLRPDGSINSSNHALKDIPSPPARIPEGHRIIVLAGNLGVVASQMGNHAFVVKLDDVEVARAHFTLQAGIPAQPVGQNSDLV